MKNHFVGLAAVAACALSSGASAQTYASVAGGQGRIAVECAGASACDTQADAYRFLAGRRFAGGISAEVGLIDFGEATRYDGAGSIDYVVTGITAGAAVDAPISSSFGFFTRLGLAMLRTQVRSSTDNTVAPYVGLGLYVTPWQNIRLELSVDQSRAEFRGSKGDVRAVMLGARVLF
ncbi:MAG: hypothetical protein KF892_09285 [Rhizobacter sp.]|nr:hypothetical protein [Rhizobacter sp.]